MKKIICKEFGPVDNLVWEDTEDHEPLPNEVVVDIKAAALNFPDYLIVQGLYQFQPPLPFTPGNEGAGIIKKIGSEVTKHKVGDRVSFMSAIGAFAEVGIWVLHVYGHVTIQRSPVTWRRFLILIFFILSSSSEGSNAE